MVRAKFSCEYVKKMSYGSVEVFLRAVTAKQGEVLNPENESFSKATPNGTLTMTIDNPGAQAFFTPGKNYYLDFTEEPKE